MKIAYGKDTPTTATDTEVIEVRQLMAIFRKVLRSGTYIVEWMPCLKYVPWYGRELKVGYEGGKRLDASHLNRWGDRWYASHPQLFNSFHSRVTRMWDLRSC